eukprot:scaffold35729_cov22-Cyclotella_meneghiniana.AAC.1
MSSRADALTLHISSLVDKNYSLIVAFVSVSPRAADAARADASRHRSSISVDLHCRIVSLKRLKWAMVMADGDVAMLFHRSGLHGIYLVRWDSRTVKAYSNLKPKENPSRGPPDLKVSPSASQHKTMFHKNDIDRNRNNIGCIGGDRRLIHSIDSVPPGTSAKLFKRRSPLIQPILS